MTGEGDNGLDASEKSALSSGQGAQSPAQSEARGLMHQFNQISRTSDRATYPGLPDGTQLIASNYEQPNRFALQTQTNRYLPQEQPAAHYASQYDLGASQFNHYQTARHYYGGAGAHDGSHNHLQHNPGVHRDSQPQYHNAIQRPADHHLSGSTTVPEFWHKNQWGQHVTDIPEEPMTAGTRESLYKEGAPFPIIDVGNKYGRTPYWNALKDAHYENRHLIGSPVHAVGGKIVVASNLEVDIELK